VITLNECTYACKKYQPESISERGFQTAWLLYSIQYVFMCSAYNDGGNVPPLATVVAP